ncbi:DNA-directed RNA polymerase subunit beta [Sesbania bispinosa]|nr:DNA-directed RNA polymerase subunit beta [Sesbania bispinosa]
MGALVKYLKHGALWLIPATTKKLALATTKKYICSKNNNERVEKKEEEMIPKKIKACEGDGLRK